MHAKLFQSCSTCCNSMGYSLQVFSVHLILQARILEWVGISYSRESSWLRDWTYISYVSCLAGRFFTTSATWEAQELKVIVLYYVGVCVHIQKNSLKSLTKISTDRSHPLVLYLILISWAEILKIFCFYVLILYRNHDEEPPPGRNITVTSKQSYLKVKIWNDHIVNLSRDL